MATSKSMQKPKSAENNAFYILWQDIADELPLCREQLRGKRILCPCDFDESYDEVLVYKAEGYVAPDNLFNVNGTIKEIDIAHPRWHHPLDVKYIRK